MTDRKLLEEVRDALDKVMEAYQRYVLTASGETDFYAADPSVIRAATTLARVEAALAETEEKRDIKDAPRDGTVILAHVRADLLARWPETEDGSLSSWADRWVPVKHGGVIDRSDEGEDPIDLYWTVALPVGHGGLHDNWFDDWVPHPRAAIAAMGE